MAQDISIQLGFDLKEFTAGMSAIRSGMEGMAKSADLAGKQMSAAFKPLTQLGTALSLAIAAPMALITAMGMDTAQTIERETKRITSAVGGNAAEAAYVIEACDAAAKKSTFGKDQLMVASRELLTFGVNAADIPAKLEMISKMAKNSGNSLEDITKIFEKISAEGEVSSRTLKEFTNANINIITPLADHFKIVGANTAAVIKEMASQGKISLADVDAAMQAMTTSGGQYSADLAADVTTLAGSTAQATHDADEARQAFMSALTPSLIATQHAISELCRWWTNLSDSTRENIVGIAKVVAVVATLTLVAAKTVTVIAEVRAAMIALNMTMAVNPFVLVTMAITALIAVTYELLTADTAAEKAEKALTVARNERALADKGSLIVSAEVSNSLHKQEEYLNHITSATERAAKAQEMADEARRASFSNNDSQEKHQLAMIESYWIQYAKVQLAASKNYSGGNTTNKKFDEQKAASDRWMEYIAKANDDEVALENAKYQKEKDALDKDIRDKLVSIEQGEIAKKAIKKVHDDNTINLTKKAALENANLWSKSLQLNPDVTSKFLDILKDMKNNTVMTATQIAQTIAATITSAVAAGKQLMTSLFAAEEQGIEKHFATLSAAEQAYQSYQVSQDAIAYSHMSASEKKAEDLKNASSTAEKARKRQEALELTRLKRQEAIANKAIGETEVGINTAIAVMKIASQAGLYSAPMIAATIALGAIQAAAIAAEPLPTTAMADGGFTNGTIIQLMRGEAGQEMTFPLTGQSGKTAMAALTDSLMSSIQKKVSNTSSNVLPYQSSVQANRAAMLNQQQPIQIQPADINIDGNKIGESMFQLSKQGRMLHAASSVVSVS